MSNQQNKKKKKNAPKKVKKKQVLREVKRVQAPVAKTAQMRTGRAEMKSLPNGDCRVSHREYLGDVKAISGTPSGYGLSVLYINPGIVNSFPWLSKLALNYESYRFNNLKFIYEPECSTATSGTVMLTVDYDVLDAFPVDKLQVMAYRGSTRTSPWSRVEYICKSEDLHKAKTNYVRHDDVPESADARLYDIGMFMCATQGAPANAMLGELYVQYDVTLMTPSYINTDTAFASSIGGYVSSFGGCDNDHPLGTSPGISAGSSGFTIVSVGAHNRFTLAEAGTWLFLSAIKGVTADANSGTADQIDAAFTVYEVKQNYNTSNYWCTNIWTLEATAGVSLEFDYYCHSGTGVQKASVWLAKVPDGSLPHTAITDDSKELESKEDKPIKSKQLILPSSKSKGQAEPIVKSRLQRRHRKPAPSAKQ